MNTLSFNRFKQTNFELAGVEKDGICITFQSPSNIAFVKYWGKNEGQIPANPSLSMTLDHSVTQTRVTVTFHEPLKGVLSVNGDPYHPFRPKLRQLFSWLGNEIPLLKDTTVIVTTQNSFPHSTGIASSASGLSAFALCMIRLATTILRVEILPEEEIRMASFAARMGSGSACRSLYGGFTVWGYSAAIPESSDEYAIPVNPMVHPEMLQLRDAILVISTKPKMLPSSLGHRSMEGHPFAGARVAQAHQHLEQTIMALAGNDFDKLGVIAEAEALTLHALLMSATPGVLLMLPATIGAIQRVRDARGKGLPIFFTLDAGANLHVIYPAAESVAVAAFIRDALQPLCDEGRVIFDRCGDGPIMLNSPTLFL